MIQIKGKKMHLKRNIALTYKTEIDKKINNRSCGIKRMQMSIYD